MNCCVAWVCSAALGRETARLFDGPGERPDSTARVSWAGCARAGIKVQSARQNNPILTAIEPRWVLPVRECMIGVYGRDCACPIERCDVLDKGFFSFQLTKLSALMHI